MTTTRPIAAAKSATAPAPKPARPTTPAAKPAGKCSLALTINGTVYAVRPLKPEAFGTIRAFKLTRPDGVAHRVGETIEGFRCTCDDFKYRHAGQDGGSGVCKHIRAMSAVGIW